MTEIVLPHCILVALLVLCVHTADGAGRPDWWPRNQGGCVDENCCIAQCRKNGLANFTSSKHLTCTDACLLRLTGLSQSDVEERCYSSAGSSSGQCKPHHVKSEDHKEAHSLHACLEGSAVGTNQPNISADAKPKLVQPPSFFWDMDIGPEMSGRGFSWYTRIFALFEEGHPLNMQMGMAGTWFSQEAHYDACPCDPKKSFGTKCCKAGQSCDCAGWLFQSFEGGPGYWMAELPTTVSKWRPWSYVGCYDFDTGSPLFKFGQYGGLDCSTMGLAQLSNQMLVPPDGLTFEVEGMLGVAVAHTPFGKVNDTDPRNFWTVILDTENFAGPLVYFLPEWWELRQPGYEEQSKHFPDYAMTPELKQGSTAFEWNTLQYYQEGSTVKLPKMTAPYKNGRSVLMMNNRVFPDDSGVAAPLEKALQSGHLDVSTIMAAGTPRKCGERSGPAKYSQFPVGTTKTTVEDGECVWSLKLDSECEAEGDCTFPTYFDSGHPIPESKASPDLKASKFPAKGGNQAYDQLNRGRSCISSPGPASDTLFCTRTLKGGESSTWLGYKWYKFVDQPGMQRARLSQKEKDYMQGRVETLHKMAGRTSRWIKNRGASAEGLATTDSAAMVSPPAGMEHGYVPIVLYEGFQKPQGCQGPTPTPPSPPSPTPPSPPSPPPPPSPPSPSGCGSCKVCFNPTNHKCQTDGAHRPKTKAACEGKGHIWCGPSAFQEYV